MVRDRAVWIAPSFRGAIMDSSHINGSTQKAIPEQTRMSQTFNPYREWLSIVSTNPSPNYYELLGLPPREPDMGKINAAYQRQSNRLASQLGGYRAEIAHRLIGELAEARMTLMTPTAKR